MHLEIRTIISNISNKNNNNNNNNYYYYIYYRGHV